MDKLIYNFSTLELQTDFSNDEFVIMGCGKHGNEKKYLTKAEASLLYVELHKFLFNNDK